MLGDLAKAELEVELTAHLDYARHVQGEGVVAKNARNGKISEDPQDGADLGGPGGVASAAEPSRVVRAVLVPKRAGRVSGGLDDMVISLYAHGMSVRDVVHLEQVYGTQLSGEREFASTFARVGEARPCRYGPGGGLRAG